MSAKPISTIDLALSLIGMIKTGAIVLVMVVLEFSRMKQAKAENEAAKAQNDLAIMKMKEVLKHDKRSDVDVISDYLDQSGKG